MTAIMDKERVSTQTDSLAAYFAAISERPLLSPIEEKRLARRARAGCRRSKDELVKRNLRLVVATAKNYRGQGLEFEDLIQEGNAGLITAAGKFDPEQGWRFSTYATWWIRQAVSRAVAERSRTIRIPAHVSDNRHRIYVATRGFEARHGREPSLAELVEMTGMNTKVIEWANSVPQNRASLDAPVRTDEPDGSALGELIADAEQDGEVAENALSALSHAEIWRALSILPERERWIVERHYGLDGDDPATLARLSEQMGVNRQRAATIKRQALKRLSALLDEKEAGERVA